MAAVGLVIVGFVIRKCVINRCQLSREAKLAASRQQHCTVVEGQRMARTGAHIRGQNQPNTTAVSSVMGHGTSVGTHQPHHRMAVGGGQ